jgi:hypothetical protein
MSKLIIGKGTRQLVCPVCKDGYMHHEAVDVIMRDGEDCDATRTICTRGAPKVTRVRGAAIKETRRDVLRISFSCENCCLGEILRERVQPRCRLLTAPIPAQATPRSGISFSVCIQITSRCVCARSV